MRYCLICEGNLPEEQFKFDLDVCWVCYRQLNRSIDFVEPHGSNIHSAYLRLFLAIKKQAELDGKFDEFERYWLKNPTIKYIQKLLWG